MPGTFKAFVVDKKEEGFTATFKDLTEADLPPGEVLVKVAYSSVNYKDGLASIPEGKIVRNYPFVPGVDVAGVVVESSDPRFKPGDEVIATSYELGADEILTREETTAESNRPLEKERWAGSVDAVGGATLAYLLRTTRYGGSIAACGNTGGANFSTTVFPFILRSVNLLGIESVNCPMELRHQVWEHLASDYKPKHLLDLIGHEAPLEELPQALATVLKGGVRGRTVIKVS